MRVVSEWLGPWDQVAKEEQADQRQFKYYIQSSIPHRASFPLARDTGAAAEIVASLST